MPYPPKYTAEQRKQVYDLFWVGRTNDKSSRGKYTGKQIEDKTGVRAAMVYAIAHGKV